MSGNDEKVILFRKKVQVWPGEMAKVTPFPLKGINDIMRYNITEYVRKMDNPSIPLYGACDNDNFKPVEGKKIYRLTFVMQCVFEGKTEYKRFVVYCDRNGIIKVE